MMNFVSLLSDGRKRAVWLCAFAMAVSVGAAVVAPEVAQRAAWEQATRLYPDSQWVCVEQSENVDVDGAPASYAFFFAARGSVWTAEGAVRTAVLAGETGDDGESDLYANTLTVLTGANDTDSLLLSHFRGLPSWWAEQVRAEAKGQVADVVMMNPAEFRRVSAPAAAAKGTAVEGARRAADREWKTLRAEKSARTARAAARMEGLDPEWRAKAEEGLAEAQAVKKAQWAAAAARAAAEGGAR